MALVQKVFGFLYRELGTGIQPQQVRHQFVNRRMLKDYHRRMTVKEYGKERVRLNSMRKNKVLPPELQAIASEEIAALPRNSCRTRLVCRCCVTSRARGTVKPYRISRIVFRHLADYNFLAGWQRAMWLHCVNLKVRLSNGNKLYKCSVEVKLFVDYTNDDDLHKKYCYKFF